MEKLYSIRRYRSWNNEPEIEEWDIAGETEKTWFVEQRTGGWTHKTKVHREAMHGSYELFFKTRNEALAEIARRAAETIESAREEIKAASAALKRIKGELSK